MCEMLWSDPKPAAGRGPSQRGVGVGFGPDVTRNFLEDNKLDLLVRSHEASPPFFLLAFTHHLLHCPTFCNNHSAIYTMTAMHAQI